MQIGEEAAKAAWLAKTATDVPTWIGGYEAAADAPLMADTPSTGWLVPGAPKLSLEAADEMTNVALYEAASRSFNPVSCIVLDASGRTIVQKTQLGCGILSPELARAKANVCVGLLCSSRELRDKYQNSDGIGPKMPQ